MNDENYVFFEFCFYAPLSGRKNENYYDESQVIIFVDISGNKKKHWS